MKLNENIKYITDLEIGKKVKMMRERLVELIKNAHDEQKYLTSDKSINAIADYLIANGVVVPPCKVGDKVYHICNVFNDSKMKSETIIKTRVVDFVQSMAFLAESQGLIFSERDFGKTVFLNREDAERALKGDEWK